MSRAESHRSPAAALGSSAPLRAVVLAVATASAAALLCTVLAAPAGAAAPRVAVAAKAIHKPLAVRAFRATRVVVRNRGTRPVRGLTLSVRRPKGVVVRLAGAPRHRLQRRVGTLRAGRAVRVRVRLRRTAKGPRRGRIVVTVRRAGHVAARARLRFGARRVHQPTQDPNSLAGRYFWGSNYTLNGTDQLTLYFTDAHFVYTKATEHALPTCSAVTDACKRYTYRAKTGRLMIDGKAATLEKRKLELDGDTYFEWGFPPAGTRWDTRVTYANSSGLCPLFCSYYTENLTFRPDGTFLRDAVSSGTGPVVDWASVPPDSKGTYQVRADHTLRLAFADGTERIETVALYVADDGSLQPVGDGLLLGGDGYFDIRD